MSNIYGRQVVVPLTNKSGGGVVAGDVVIIDTTNNEAFTTTTSAGFTGGVGIAQETIANNATGRVLTDGYAALVNVNASVTRGNYGKTHTVAKQATDAGSSRTGGTFCQFLTGGTTPTARVYPPDLAAAAGNVAVDAIWDAAGDLAVGSGADTAARLAKGSAGGALTIINSAVAWNSGTSFPGSKATGDRFWRTDLGMEWYWNGSLWVTTTLYVHPFGAGDANTPQPNDATFGRMYPGLEATFSRLFLERFQVGTFVASGTNNGSNYWTVKVGGSDASTITSVNTSADSVGAWFAHASAPAAQIGAGLKDLEFQTVKTGTPGPIYVAGIIAYRLVTT